MLLRKERGSDRNRAFAALRRYRGYLSLGVNAQPFDKAEIGVIVPLGAVATLATLSAQNVQPRAHRDTGSTFVREQVVDCGTRNPKEVCVISYDSETPR